MALANKSSHLRLQALLVDLASYNVRFVQGSPVEQLWTEALEGASRAMRREGEEDVELPVFPHTDKIIKYPATSRPLPARITASRHITAFFDGGAAKRLGTGGFCVFSGEGLCIHAQACYYGDLLETNNRAEAKALEQLMGWLAAHREMWDGAPAVVIYGDS
jgi:hypothetical protein